MLQILIGCPIGGIGARFLRPIHLFHLFMVGAGFLEKGLGSAPTAQKPQTEGQADEPDK